ncbi:DUF4183 domain-containing protein [Konateibacter massiliensis]|uniref:DUF4183 domain-containing protein n=1 Tax=Konateibacter massiliensis TaxID=2002841 RepID=UPI000C15D085|nr:DUF4183 domain-containing protein [Konateibacter massiliensis]
MFEDNTLSIKQEKNLLNADVYQYNTLSDGVKRIYTNDDELIQYGDRGILDPNDVSFFNLFINGVLQPKVNYEIQKGLLLLKTEDVPIKDSAIIISFITFEDKNAKSTKLNSALVEGILPTGEISSGPATDIDICVWDDISNYLYLESTLLCGPECIPTGCNGIWEFTLTVSNISHIPIANILIIDTILLDFITNIENTFVSCGNILIKDGVITWNIGTLDPCESATANFRVEGFFQAEGTRYIGRSMAYGSTTSGSVNTDIICINPINVSQGLKLTQTITSGPTKVNANTVNAWRVEIKISNLSVNTVSGILISNILFLDHIKCIKIINISHGAAAISGNELLWKIDALRERDTSVLMVDIIGCFCQNGFKTLGIALGVGSMNTKKIFSNLSQDFQIAVSPKMNIEKKKLLLQAHVFNNSMKIFLDQPKKWTFCLNITNTYNEIMNNLIVIDYILLDDFKNITIKSITAGKISVSDNAIIWKIEDILPCETLTAIIEVDGLFNTTGCRSLSRAIAGSSDSNSCITSNITSGYPVKVLFPRKYAKSFFYCNPVINHAYNIVELKTCLNFLQQKNLLSAHDRTNDIHRNNDCPDIFGDLSIEKYIVSGPLEVNANKINTWRVEIRISNYGYGPVNNIVMTDTLRLDDLTCFTPISFTKGTISQKNNIVTWDIGTLNSKNTVVLLAEITGSFHKKNNKILNVSDYQYNTVSNGIKKEFTNTDEILIYGEYGIPNPNDVSFFNLYINGVLQPETNYFVETGLLTLTIADPPKENAPIILEYLVIKDKDNQLIKAETYQYNTLSNREKTYTDADELTVYGDWGILDPKHTSYNSLFVNGVIQPSVNYTIKPGMLTLTVEYAPVKEAPILVKFFSLYLYKN